MNDLPFYAEGLKFFCTRCSSCCRHESGFVYLSENDLSRLANKFGMDYTAFVETWCRWIPFTQGRERLSLKEKSNFDCIFWNGSAGDTASEGGAGCTVYHVRPLQCRSFPFWDFIVCSQQAWEAAGKDCPGINNGEHHSREKIEAFISQMEEEPVIEREVRN
ncbi:MAG: YkgJ family cysteine cluster protein [Treponema sp.]|jgi:Fe-S-cluster containining protein|nr:YkgJ family cysteine cluster protein [Treponema sp.]